MKRFSVLMLALLLAFGFAGIAVAAITPPVMPELTPEVWESFKKIAGEEKNPLYWVSITAEDIKAIVAGDTEMEELFLEKIEHDDFWVIWIQNTGNLLEPADWTYLNRVLTKNAEPFALYLDSGTLPDGALRGNRYLKGLLLQNFAAVDSLGKNSISRCVNLEIIFIADPTGWEGINTYGDIEKLKFAERLINAGVTKEMLIRSNTGLKNDEIDFVFDMKKAMDIIDDPLSLIGCNAVATPFFLLPMLFAFALGKKRR